MTLCMFPTGDVTRRNDGRKHPPLRDKWAFHESYHSRIVDNHQKIESASVSPTLTLKFLYYNLHVWILKIHK